MSQDIEQQLLAAKALTQMSGVIADIQLHQLKCWGVGLFGKDGWKLTVPIVDQTGEDVSAIDFEIVYTVSKVPQSKYLKALEESVKHVFGDRWTCKVVQGKFTKGKKNVNKGKGTKAADRGAKPGSKRKDAKPKAKRR